MDFKVFDAALHFRYTLIRVAAKVQARIPIFGASFV
jgi:hypothetical protein